MALRGHFSDTYMIGHILVSHEFTFPTVPLTVEIPDAGSVPPPKAVLLWEWVF